MSTCKRSKGDTCLLYGHNDGRIGIMGDGLSGWLVVTLPELKEGLVFARMEVRYNSSLSTSYLSKNLILYFIFIFVCRIGTLEMVS